MSRFASGTRIRYCRGPRGDVALGICQAQFWPFRAGGIGPDGKDPIAEVIEDENQRPEPDREAPEQAPEGAQDM
jgi:hypothetical protein